MQNAMNAMPQWMRSQSLTYRSLATQMGQSYSNVWKKVNGHMAWRPSDLRFLHDTYGLSSDFVLGLSDGVERADTQLGVA